MNVKINVQPNFLLKLLQSDMLHSNFPNYFSPSWFWTEFLPVVAEDVLQYIGGANSSNKMIRDVFRPS